jgi:methionyl-tRNA formyltransferase
MTAERSSRPSLAVTAERSTTEAQSYPSAAPPRALLNLILMGTGPFAVPAFEALCDAGHQIPLVITRPQRAVRSRSGPPPSPVREFARRRGLSVDDPQSINAPEAIQKLATIGADLLVVCDYGQILSDEALSQGRLGGINLHGSLLPAYRGAAPVQWAILQGEKVTGVSVIHMTPRLDGGPILASAATPIDQAETAGQLEHRLAQLGVAPTLAAVGLLARWDGSSPIGQPQDASTVSRAPRLSKASGRIDWRWPAEKIDRHVRGMQPWPGAFTEVQVWPSRPPLRLAIIQVRIVAQAEPASAAQQAGAAPGTLLSDAALQVATGQGVIQIDRLQVAGKNEVSGEQFLRGYRLAAGTLLGDASSV